MDVDMDTIVVRQFVHFFQDFINLCRKQNWPNNDTTPEEMRNAFLMAQHVEKCLDKFQKRSLLDEFLSILNDTEDISCLFIKSCLTDPPKYVLKKIINSPADISKVDVGFTIFLELYSEEKLEICLRELMLEASSKEILLKSMKPRESSKHYLNFKTDYLLSAISNKDRTAKGIELMLKSGEKEEMELLVQCMLCNNVKHDKAVDTVKESFLDFISNKSASRTTFWKLFFSLEEKMLLELCSKYNCIFKIVVTAILDVGECIQNEISLDYFYIELSNDEMVKLVKMFCKNDNLKLAFLDVVAEQNVDSEYWSNLIAS